ncbi:MAG TPA: hypothetical protein VFP72_21405 [Kineosporiaceae bacterium]|nr:hypothetical protein [Kineosporiaceae bacterium]
MSVSSGPRPALLPGGPAEPGSQAPAAAGQPGRSGPRKVPVPLLAVAAAAVVLVGAGAGYLLLGGNGGDTGPGTVASATHRSAATRSAPGTAAPTASATTAPAPAPVTGGRNPFLAPAGASSTAAPGTAGDTGAATGTATTPGTATTTSAPSTTTVTATVTAKPVYLGLYGFVATTPEKADFWLNATEYKVAVGGTFGGYRYSSKTSAGCARVTKASTTTTICPGQVKKLT